MIPKIATREAYGKTLVKLGQDNPDIVVLDADLSKSTTTHLFAKEFPERFFECGIAEQNMMGIAAGMAAAGKVPFASTFAVFATSRCFDQIRVSIAQPRLNVKIVASHGGITVGEDGASHHAIEDLSLMCSLPGFNVIVPADAIETAQAVMAAARLRGPFYIRCGRPPVPLVHDENYEFILGKARTMREGPDATIIAIGIMVEAALKAAADLVHEGIGCRVLNMSTLKPLDIDAVLCAARDTGAIVTAEEHLLQGGLGSAVAQVVAEENPVPMAFIAIRDAYSKSGRPDELLQQHNLTPEAVAQAVRNVVARKKRS